VVLSIACQITGRELLNYLTPCVPLSFKGEGEGYKKRGFASLGLSL